MISTIKHGNRRWNMSSSSATASQSDNYHDHSILNGPQQKEWTNEKPKLPWSFSMRVLSSSSPTSLQKPENKYSNTLSSGNTETGDTANNKTMASIAGRDYQQTPTNRTSILQIKEAAQDQYVHDSDNGRRHRDQHNGVYQRDDHRRQQQAMQKSDSMQLGSTRHDKSAETTAVSSSWRAPSTPSRPHGHRVTPANSRTLPRSVSVGLTLDALGLPYHPQYEYPTEPHQDNRQQQPRLQQQQGQVYSDDGYASDSSSSLSGTLSSSSSPSSIVSAISPSTVPRPGMYTTPDQTIGSSLYYRQNRNNHYQRSTSSFRSGLSSRAASFSDRTNIPSNIRYAKLLGDRPQRLFDSRGRPIGTRPTVELTIHGYCVRESTTTLRPLEPAARIVRSSTGQNSPSMTAKEYKQQIREEKRLARDPSTKMLEFIPPVRMTTSQVIHDELEHCWGQVCKLVICGCCLQHMQQFPPQPNLIRSSNGYLC